MVISFREVCSVPAAVNWVLSTRNSRFVATLSSTSASSTHTCCSPARRTIRARSGCMQALKIRRSRNRSHCNTLASKFYAGSCGCGPAARLPFAETKRDLLKRSRSLSWPSCDGSARSLGYVRVYGDIGRTVVPSVVGSWSRECLRVPRHSPPSLDHASRDALAGRIRDRLRSTLELIDCERKFCKMAADAVLPAP